MRCDHSLESYSTVLSCDVSFVIQCGSNILFCGSNPMQCDHSLESY